MTPAARRLALAIGAVSAALAIASAGGGSADSTAQSTAQSTPDRERDETSMRAIDDALRARDFARADRLIEARLAEGARDPVLLYNHACTLAQLGRLAPAEARLLEAVKAGFREFDLMEEDEDLEPIRGSETYAAIMEARHRAEEARNGNGDDGPDPGDREPHGRRGPIRAATSDPLAAWKSSHPEGYRYDFDERYALHFATYLDEASHARMRALLAELAEHLTRTYFGKPPTAPSLVAIVRPEDADAYLERPEVKGMYLHAARRLVARDSGQSLQHEFVHLLHFAWMERTGARHPLWVQEGLASLYEDYTIRPDGSAEFHPNVRFNLARKQVVARVATPWRELFAMKPTAFMREAERVYPQVRAIFEFLAHEGRLVPFLRALDATWRDDPGGTAAIERAFGEPLAKVESRWKDWMIRRGEIDDEVERGDASLGVAVEDAGDGVRIRSFVVRSAARAAGLRVGDVIIAIGRRPVRNREELVIAVARLEIGRPVRIDYRRDGAESSVEVSPRALGR